MQLPKLSELDLEESTEGSSEALGLDAIAEELAHQLIPGIRERHQHPRFLTSIAVSLYLCSHFQDWEVASDQLSEPWQVFEWHYVEGLVRHSEDRSDVTGLPGVGKVRQANQDRLPLNARRYLKSAANNGFHGIYRGLARDLQIEEANLLAPIGEKLLTCWENEQQLEGFFGGDSGPGLARRTQLLDALRSALDQGQVERKANWQGWTFFHDHLHFRHPGIEESKVILKALREDTEGFRREILDAIKKPEAKQIWKSTRTRWQFEALLHQLLAAKGSPAIQPLLQAIESYESFSLLLHNAFHACIEHLAQQSLPSSTLQLAKLDHVSHAARSIHDAFQRCVDHLGAVSLSSRFIASFSHFADVLPPNDWLHILFEHHRSVQDRKLPIPRAHWIDQLPGGTWLIRSAYRESAQIIGAGIYLHPYRAQSLRRFAEDLHWVT